LNEVTVTNLHATAIVLAGSGVLVTGPSGCGKSAMALALIEAAGSAGHFACLVADDRVDMSFIAAQPIASAPPAIAGLMEIRGSGVVAVPFMRRAVMHLALAPAAMAGPDRVPPEDERLELAPDRQLPLLRIRYGAAFDTFAALSLILAARDLKFTAPRHGS
jgi:serine kinase of HPr protein (carbohydrate metabolism regulator)